MSRSAEEQARILKAAGGDIRRHLPTIKADGSVDFEHGDLRALLRATAAAYDVIVKVVNCLQRWKSGVAVPWKTLKSAAC